MKKLIVMRGLSGSGKSTRAGEIKRQIQGDLTLEKHVLVSICSADHYFITQEGYKFDHRLLKEAHASCKHKAKQCMESGDEVVIIDNTNIQKWEYQPYLDMAKEFGYEVEVVMVGNLTDIDLYSSRNTHGVPKEVIERMVRRFEL